MQNAREHFDRLAPTRERSVRRNRYYYQDLLTFLRHVIPADARVIELGSGIGNILDALPQQERTGIDFSPAMIAEAERRNTSRARYILDDIEHLRHSESYDVVLLLDTINSLRDVQSALSQVRVKLCHDRTRLILTYYNLLWEPLLRLGEFFGLKTPMPEQSWLSRGDVRALLSLAHFEVVTEGQRLLFPRFFPGVSWFCNTVLAKLPLFRRLCLVQYVIARPLPHERKEYSVSIIIPARNEAGNIARALETMPRFGTSQEIIFVEGGSSDNTAEAIRQALTTSGKQWEITSLTQRGKGKGDAVRMGFAAATKDVLMILDADLTVDPSELPKFYDALCSGVGEFINGSRLVYPMEKQAMQILNMLANTFFGILFSFLLSQRIKDTLCGTKVLLRSDYERITGNRSFFGDFDPFGDFDLLFGAAKRNLKIIDVPVRYRERTYGSTNIQRWRHGVLLLRMCGVAARKLKFL